MPRFHAGSRKPFGALFALLAPLALVAAAAPSLAACGPRGILVDRASINGGGDPEKGADAHGSNGSNGSKRTLAVATSAREIKVDSQSARTPIGHFKPGERVSIHVVEARWTHFPNGPLVGAAGSRDLPPCDGGSDHECIAGDGIAPLMGLVLIDVPTSTAIRQVAACRPLLVRPIPNGVEFAMPQDADINLAPNDWEDGLFDNTGAINVEVETARDKSAPASSRRRVSVDAKERRTSLGRFPAGQYVRISVVGGRWNNDPNAPLFGPEGSPNDRCFGGGSHVCPAGEATAPIMALVMIMSPCAEPALPTTTRRYIPDDIDYGVAREADLFLAPNDWEDGLFDNSGSATVLVDVQGQ